MPGALTGIGDRASTARRRWIAALIAGLLVPLGCAEEPRPIDHPIQQLKDPARPDRLASGAPTRLSEVVVTAVGGMGAQQVALYVQEPAGGEHGGVRVEAITSVLPSDTALVPGSRVTVEGLVRWDAISDTRTAISVLADRVTWLHAGDPPAPLPVEHRAVGRFSDASALDGLLVRVENARVLSVIGDGQYALHLGLRVSLELMAEPTSLELQGCYAALTGVLSQREAPFLLVRFPEDLERSPDDARCESPPELCTDGVDNDGNGSVDCDDVACRDNPSCVERDCADGVDNDGDGHVDCDDADCGAESHCTRETRCDDGLDDDGDGRIDCLDWDCEGHPACAEADCTNGVDDDGDGLTDCEEHSCRLDPAADCRENDPGRCSDGLDNDGDGWIDCHDPSCRAHPDVLAAGTCPDEETGDEECSDGVTNDADGKVDCLDDSCYYNPLVTVCAAVRESTLETCADGLDNDGNGHVDCGDWSCLQACACPDEESDPESCSDGLDNDGDGFVDCDDWSCRFCEAVTHCEASERSCSDGLDNDGDGLVDCEDPGCCSETFSMFVCRDAC